MNIAIFIKIYRFIRISYCIVTDVELHLESSHHMQIIHFIIQVQARDRKSVV